MRRRWAALAVLALGLLQHPGAQAQPPQAAHARNPGVILGQNYPNPFTPDTRIPFSVGDAAGCKDPNRQFKVTLRIYNLLSQPIAVPVMQDGGGGVSTGQPIEGKMLPCSQYTAYWDGQYQTLRDGKMVSTGRPVPEGIYLYRLEVDGFVIVRKMVVKR